MSMSVDFLKAAKLTGAHEAGFTDNPKDRGNWTSGVIGKGELKGTKGGISAMSYPDLDIRNLSDTAIKEIYYRDYWLKCSADKMPRIVKFAIFDACINHGPGNAKRFLQRALNVVDDGVIGAITLGQIDSILESELLTRFQKERITFMTKISTWPTFGKGWAIRVVEVSMQSAFF